LKKTSKGKDPRNINIPSFNNPEIVPETRDLSHAAKLDSIWDGESIDEEKETEVNKFF